MSSLAADDDAENDQGNDAAANPMLRFVVTTKPDNLQIDREPRALGSARRRNVDRPWMWLRQVHGSHVVAVDRNHVDELAGAEADALVTSDTNLALAVHVADCAPVFFASAEGVIGVAHAGWRGVQDRVIEKTVAAMRESGALTITALIGPCIHAECYEFAAADLDRLAARYGDEVRATTASGAPAFDVREAIRRAAHDAGVVRIDDMDLCTACLADEFYSHRARAETGRMAAVIWREELDPEETTMGSS